MSKDQYVILTGSKNNAGDYLIKYRAKQLLQSIRPDRIILDYDAWKPFDEEQLVQVNYSKALILTGGPALQYNMRPNVYKMTADLNKIKVPIIMMGIGWKSLKGDWESTYNYPLSKETIDLLDRIENTGYLSSVRDYHTLNVLRHKGYKNVLMTGCPALYSLEHVNNTEINPQEINNISFSMGVSFVSSKFMEKVTKETILSLKEYFIEKSFKVVFHHSIDKSQYLQAYSHNRTVKNMFSRNKFIDKHFKFINWLEENSIKYIDISGTEQYLIEHYSQADLHIGFRVHAHIFMSSISKPSILLTEDGRGKALKNILGGLILDSYLGLNKPFLGKYRLNDPFKTNLRLPDDLINNLNYELNNSYPRLKNTRQNIDSLFPVIKQFVEQLP